MTTLRWLHKQLLFLKQLKNHAIHWLFATLPLLFRHTRSYQHWEEATRRPPAITPPKVVTSPVDPATPAIARTIRFDPPAVPAVTVIIPVYGKLSHTLHCLRSIQASDTRTAFEILVIDDCSDDDTAELLALVTGIRVVRNAQNLGFLLSCNKAASLAQGDFLLFLNNDTEVAPGWLDALYTTFEDKPDAGLVGSKLLFADGRLQEAGGIIWEDASGMNYGRGDDANRPEYNFLRDVDYCSGASIMLPRKHFLELGSFDTRYVPAYYEDTDLAFAVRQAGLRVLYQPLSVALHFEGVTSGTDISSGIKAFQATNQQKFLAKWQHVLVSHGTRVGDIRQMSERKVQRKALVFDWSTPKPDKDSGSIDTVNYIRMLQMLGFKVVFCPHDLDYAGHYTQALQRQGVESLYYPYTDSPKAHLQRFGASYDLVLLHRVHFAAQEIRNVRKYCRKARVLFNTVDLHYIREARQAELEQSTKLAKAARRTRKLEFMVMRKATATIVISEHERAILQRERPRSCVVALPYIREVVDTIPPLRERRDILFVGSFRFDPNIDAVCHFVLDIWPRVRTALPDVNFIVVGGDMPEQILALEAEPGVRILGYVEDLSALLDRCRITVAPLRFGAGIKGKIGTSLCHGVPCVATPLAAEGMDLRDRLEIMIGVYPEAFAQAVIEIYRDEALWTQVSNNGLDLFRREFSFERGLERFRKLLVQELGISL
jgi:O-antigen biosynthesis protein